MAMLANPDARWECPICRRVADWDDAHHEMSSDLFPLAMEIADLMNGEERIVAATSLGFWAHLDQKRDDEVTPYFSHCLRVAEKTAVAVATAAPGLWPHAPADIVAAALLHDVIEDCKPAEEWARRIRDTQGPAVFAMCQALTNPSKALPLNSPRAPKKAMDQAHYRQPSVELAVRLVKLIDRDDNIRDAKHWKPKRLQTYLGESDDLATAIMDGLHESQEYRRAPDQCEALLRFPLATLRQAILEGRERVREQLATVPVFDGQPSS